MEKSVLVFLFRWNCRSAEVQSPQYQFRTVVPAPNRRLGVAGFNFFLLRSAGLDCVAVTAPPVAHPLWCRRPSPSVVSPPRSVDIAEQHKRELRVVLSV